MTDTPITPEMIPSLSPLFRFQWEEVQQCHVILYPEGMVKLSGSAGEIMKRVDGKSSVQGIIDTLESVFEQTGLAEDIINFLQEAVQNGWIRFK